MNLIKMLQFPTPKKATTGSGGATQTITTREGLQKWLRGDEPAPIQDTADNVAWWYGAMGRITRLIADAEVEVATYDDETYTPVVDHPFEALWRDPNPYQSGREVLRRWCQGLYYYGESFLFLVMRRFPEVEALQVLHPALVDVVGGRAGPVDHYVFWPDGRGVGKRHVNIPGYQVIMSRFPDPRDASGVRGLAPLRAAAAGIAADYAMARWGNNFFGKAGGIPMAVVSYPDTLTQSAAATVEDSFVNLTSGSRRDPIVIPAGQLDVKVIDFEPDKMAFDALRTLNRKTIEYVLGIPEGISSDSATRANSTVARLTMIEQLIWPLAQMLAADLNTQWPGRLPAERFQIREMRERDLQVLSQLQAERKNYWTVNELRAEDGKEPLDGQEWDDQPAALALKGGNSPMLPAAEEPEGSEPQGGPDDAEVLADGDGGVGDEDDVAVGNDAERSVLQAVMDWANWQGMVSRAHVAGRDLPLDFASEAIPDHALAGCRRELAALDAGDRVGPVFRRWREVV